MQGQFDLNALRLLVRVVEHGSFSAAASATGIAISTISRRIASLESCTGVALLSRTTRSLALTDAGSTLLAHARLIDKAARRVEKVLQASASSERTRRSR
jgi:DNA-binding transcriptional LysR family regulator